MTETATLWKDLYEAAEMSHEAATADERRYWRHRETELSKLIDKANGTR